MTIRILWICYFALLIVLYPHTAFIFSLFERPGSEWFGYSAALVFEVSIAVLTHYLSKEIAREKGVTGGVLFSIPTILLIICIVISVVANWTYAAEFIKEDEISVFRYRFATFIYPMLFGAILPICSFAFAYVLSQSYDKERGEYPNEKEPVRRVIDVVLSSEDRLSPHEMADKANVPVEEIDGLYKEAKKYLVQSFGNGKAGK